MKKLFKIITLLEIILLLLLLVSNHFLSSNMEIRPKVIKILAIVLLIGFIMTIGYLIISLILKLIDKSFKQAIVSGIVLLVTFFLFIGIYLTNILLNLNKEEVYQEGNTLTIKETDIYSDVEYYKYEIVHSIFMKKICIIEDDKNDLSNHNLIISFDFGVNKEGVLSSLSNKYDLVVVYNYDNFNMACVTPNNDMSEEEFESLIDMIMLEDGVIYVQKDNIYYLD